jgi:hypothetical protein
MKLYSYEVSGVATETQSDAGKLRAFFWCKAYSDAQALAWSQEQAKGFLTNLRITGKVET